MDWIAIKGIPTKEERDSMALALFHAGYEVRQTKRKDGNKTVIDVEYRGKTVIICHGLKHTTQWPGTLKPLSWPVC